MVRSTPACILSSFSNRTWQPKIPSAPGNSLVALFGFLTGEGPGELTGVLVKMTLGCISNVLSMGAK